MYKNMVEKSGNLKTRDQSSKNCIFFGIFEQCGEIRQQQ